MDTNATTIPTHLLPSSCHVCGTPSHADCVKGEPCRVWAARVHEQEPPRRPLCPHDLTNTEAMAAATEHDRRATFAYSTGATTPEGAYVDQHRPA